MCASKMGALGLTRELADELGPHDILVNLVVPGTWDFSAATIADIPLGAPGMDEIPLGRRGLPQELANVYAFLASDESSYITGQTFHVVNGGRKPARASEGRRSLFWLVLTLSVVGADAGSAQENWDLYQIGSVRVDRGPEIDGVLDDSVWETAAVIDEFIQQDPNEGAPATEEDPS